MKKTDFLKLLALTTMIVDHIGAVFFPSVLFLRIIGRISFPIYSYCIAFGYVHTKNISKYMIRLLICGTISQIPYYLLFEHGLNILFTLLYGLTVIYLYDKVNVLLGISLLFLSLLFKSFDYGFYGISSIFLFYLFNEKRSYSIFMQLMLILLKVYVLNGHEIQFYSLLALPLIYFISNKEWKVPMPVNKYLFYIAYPTHLIILLVFKYFLGTPNL